MSFRIPSASLANSLSWGFNLLGPTAPTRAGPTAPVQPVAPAPARRSPGSDPRRRAGGTAKMLIQAKMEDLLREIDFGKTAPGLGYASSVAAAKRTYPLEAGLGADALPWLSGARSLRRFEHIFAAQRVPQGGPVPAPPLARPA